MKKSFIFISLVCLMFSVSCCTKPAKPVTELIQIDINPDKVEDFIDLSPMLSDSIDIIPLETTDECLLSDIERLTFYKGNFYILDATRRNIFVFDEAGRFVRKIGKQGNGPGEYSAILFFDIMGDSVLVQDHHRLNCVIYDLATGEFVKEFAHNVEVHGGFYVDGRVYFYTSYRKIDKENFNLCKLDLSTAKVVEKFIPFDEKSVKFGTTGLMNDICKYKDSVYMIFPYNDTIYQVTKDNARPLYNMHFTARNLPDDIQPVNDSFRSAAAEGEFVKGLEYMQMSKDHIWGIYIDKRRFHYMYVNRHTLEAKVTECFTVKKLGHLPVSQFFVSDDDLLSVQPASALRVSLRSILLSKFNPVAEKYKEKLEKLQKNLKEDSNPVLFRYRLKEVSQ